MDVECVLRQICRKQGTSTKLKILVRTFNDKVFRWKTILNIFQPLGTGVMSLHCTYCASCKVYFTVSLLKCKYIIATHCFSIPPAVHLTLVYLGNKVFHDTTTKAIKSPPPILNLMNFYQET